MKTIRLILLSLSVTAASADDAAFVDQDYSCVETSKDKTYDEIFVIEVRKKGLSKIKYKRRYSCSSAADYSELKVIRGCYHARQTKSESNPTFISVECKDDGQEGLFYMDPIKMTGHIYFYMPKIGYGERTGLDLKCTKIISSSLL